MIETSHERAEAELTAYGLGFPEATPGRGWATLRALDVRNKTFVLFGAKGEAHDALTIVMKLPISAEMAESLPFVRPARGWYKQHRWVTAYFGPADDVFAEMDTLKGWLKQSYRAVAPKKLGRTLE